MGVWDEEFPDDEMMMGKGKKKEDPPAAPANMEDGKPDNIESSEIKTEEKLEEKVAEEVVEKSHDGPEAPKSNEKTAATTDSTEKITKEKGTESASETPAAETDEKATEEKTSEKSSETPAAEPSDKAVEEKEIDKSSEKQAATKSVSEGGNAPDPSMSTPPPKKMSELNLNQGTDSANKIVSSGDHVQAHEARLGDETQQLLKDIRRIGDEGKPEVTFGELFVDEAVEQFYEALVGTLKSAKKRGLISFKGQMLLKGPSDKVVITIIEG